MVIDVKVPLLKTARPAILIFQDYRLENKLLQELGDEMFIIVSNTVQSKISSFFVAVINVWPLNVLKLQPIQSLQSLEAVVSSSTSSYKPHSSSPN